MGLFKRRDQTKAELDAMRADMATLRERLEKSDAAKSELAAKLGHLDERNEQISTQVVEVTERVGDVANKVGSVEHEVVTVVGTIGPTVENAVRSATDRTASTDDLDGLRHELRSLATAPEQDATTLAELRRTLDELTEALRRQQAQIADVALVATDAAERGERTDATLAEMAEADDRPVEAVAPAEHAETVRQVGQLAEKVAALDSRMNQVSLELTNQLSELSSDLDRASAQADTSELIDQITTQLGDITGGQERLANEQARYAIQFREDLAELADRLRKQR